MHKANGNTRGAFTLLEIMMAVAIMGIICGTVYQFTNTTMRAADFSVRSDAQELACAGFRRLLSAQLAGMPLNQSGALVGTVVEGKSGRRDALQIVCTSGNALLTPDAHGYYQITLDLRELPRGSGHLALGMDRQPWTDDDDDDDDDDVPSGSVKTKDILHTRDRLPADWVPLMEGVRSLEIAYFDSRLNGWVNKWVDPAALPNLVRIRLTLENGGAPYEVIERVPGGGVRQMLANPLNPLLPPGAVGTSNGTANPAPGLAFPGRNGVPVNPAPPVRRPVAR